MTLENLNPNLIIIQRLFNLDERTIEAVKGDILKREMNKSSFLSRLSINPWFVWLVSIFERLMAPRMSKKYDLANDDFAFVSCIDPVHRVRTLPLVAGDLDYTLFFLPTLTRPTVVRTYYNYYKKKPQEKVFFGTFIWRDVFKYKRFIRLNANIISEINCDNDNDTKVLREYAKRFALYKIYAERVFASVSNDRLWLFEHDKFFFIPVINYFREEGILTTQLQHGTFINPEIDTFFPLYSDKIICCSEREKELYRKSGVQESDIYVLGAPLQTIKEKSNLNVPEKYDCVLVLTHTAPKELAIQKTVLSYIKEHFTDKSVLVRFRPRSATVDKQNLAEYTSGYTISEGNSLSQDLCSAKRVITFSLDSIYEIIREKKLFVTFVDSNDIIDNSLEGICDTVDNLEDCIRELFVQNVDTKRERYLTAFGETDVEKIRNGFKTILSNLKKQNN